jgi:small subunit ribosomal protein S7
MMTSFTMIRAFLLIKSQMTLPTCRLVAGIGRSTQLMLGSIRTSVWPAHYQEPLTNVDDLNALKELDPSKFKALTYNPIKPLHHFKNNSLFFDEFLFRFESEMVIKGNRILARDLLNETLFQIKRIQLKKFNAIQDEEKRAEIELDPLVIFKQAFQNCKPVLNTKMIKRGGAKYQVPHPITEAQSISQTVKWMRDTIRDRPKPRKIHFPEAFAKELLAAYHNEGKVVKMKNDLHKLCESNKAYVHYRWS